MRKVFSLLCFAGLAMASCKKDAPPGASDPSDKTRPVAAGSHYRTTDVSTIPCTTPFGDLVQISQDDEDATNNKVCLHLSVGLREVLKNPAMAAWIHDQLSSSGSHEITVEALCAEFPAARTLLDDAIDPLGTYTGKNFATVNGLMQHEGSTLNASIYLVNAGETVADGRSLLIPGINVPESDSNDMYMAWNIAADGGHEIVGIGEEPAMNTSIPVYSIVMRPPGYSPSSVVMTASSTSAPDEPCERLDYYRVGGIRINHRYEADNWSEVEMVAIRSSSTAWLYILRNHKCSDIIKRIKLIKNIHKDDVGLYNYAGVFIGFNFELNSTVKMYFQTYERDWPSPFWTVATPLPAGNEMAAQMKYSNEYYGYDPNNIQYNPLNESAIPNVGNWYTHWNISKGFIHIDHVN